MGNSPSLRKSIQSERWDDVRTLLQSDRSAQERARSKSYVVKDTVGGSLGSSPFGKSREQLTALHLACRHRAPEDIIRTLLDVCGTDAASSASFPSGEMPLHYLVRSGATPVLSFTKWKPSKEQHEASIRALLEANRGSVYTQSSNERGAQTPLHVACEFQSSPSVIKMLVEEDPTAATEIRDAQGRTAREVAQLHRWAFSPLWRWKVRSILEQRGNNSTSSNHEQDGPAVPPSAPPMMPLAVHQDSGLSGGGEVAYGNSDADETAGGDEMCVVCWDGRADHVLIPCGHMCLCGQCAAFTTGDSASARRRGGALLARKCPVCKSQVDQSIRVFRSGVPDPCAGGVGVDEARPPPTVPVTI